MSSRERWIVYPLLFFAFCLGARDQFFFLRPNVAEIPHLSCQVIDAEWINGRKVVASEIIATDSLESKKLEGDSLRLNKLDTGEVLCQRLVAVSHDGQRLAELDGDEAGAGRLTVFDANDQPAITLIHRDQAGQLESRHKGGTRLVVRATASGGTLAVLDAEGQVLGEWPVEFKPPSPDTEKAEVRDVGE